MAFNGLILTTKGKLLQSKVQTGAQLNYTKVDVGDGTLASGQSLEALNALINKKMTLPITNVAVLGDGNSRVRTLLANTGLATGFYVREYGLFATDPDVGEILYAVGNAGNECDYLPASGGSCVVENQIDLITAIGNATNVTAVINGSVVTATLQDLIDHDKNPNAHNLLTALHLWQKGEVVAQNEIRFSAKPSVLSYKFFECTVGGTCGATEPNWPAVGQTIVDGSVTWRVRDLRSGSGMPIGHTFQVLATTPPPGCLDISSGALVNRATYPDLWAWVQQYAPLVSESAWQAQAGSQTSVGAYSTGDGSTTFRLPKIVDYVRGGVATDVGKWQGDAIRNITGAANEIYSYDDGINASNYSGAITVAKVNTTNTNIVAGTTGDSNCNITFDASKVVPTADENRPKTIKMLWVVKAFDAFTNQGLVDLTQLANDLAKKNNGLPTGSIVPFLAKAAPPGWLDCSTGALVNRSTYPGLWAWVQQNAPLLSEADWQAQAAAQTSVGAYSTGDGSTTFRLPRIVDFVSGTDVGRAAGAWRTDDFKAHKHGTVDVGASSQAGTSSMNAAQTSTTQGAWSTTVGGAETRPKSISMLYCVKAFEAIINQDMIDVTALANQLLGKVNYTDFSTWGDSVNGGMKFPNGKIMQWGSTTLTGTANGSTHVITLPLAFPNHNSVVVVGSTVSMMCFQAAGNYGTEGLDARLKTLSNFTIMHEWDGGDPTNNVNWIAIGD